MAKLYSVDLMIDGSFEPFFIGDVGDLSMEFQDEKEDQYINFNKLYEITFSTTLNIKRKTLMMLFGLPTSNNWVKMHGGIMDRNCGKRKKRRKGRKRKNERKSLHIPSL